MLNRRQLARGIAALSALTVSAAAGHAAAADSIDKLTEAFAHVEAKSGGRLGVAVFDSETGMQTAYRGDERFPMCSTSKLITVAAILKRIDTGKLANDQLVVFSAADLVTYSPVTERRVGAGGMTIAELCEAAITVSDNTAANLLINALGGPAGVTSFARQIGDQVTRLDRIEPELNEAQPGDPRDTTSPLAIASNLRTITRSGVLSDIAAGRLISWLLANKTGNARLRAGLPPKWRVGDKTGSGGNGTTNDVAVFWPSGRNAVYLSAYLTETAAPQAAREATLAAVARAVADVVTAG
ncbi:MAG TPA: class A beta-lactamase [Xanthobacteraceae bacterium]|nr:class A beta-lactamase [Xanthobacteraceae bacterium]